MYFSVFIYVYNIVQEKADYGSLIQDLGGEYYESDHFVASCTHLVVGKASRTEKYLAACSSGKWILNRTYLEACRSECTFVEVFEANHIHVSMPLSSSLSNYTNPNSLEKPCCDFCFAMYSSFRT